MQLFNKDCRLEHTMYHDASPMHMHPDDANITPHVEVIISGEGRRAKALR
jgi:hypothetical protein